jgi:hypothetical protein
LSGWGEDTHNQDTFGFHLVPTYNLIPATYSSEYIDFTSKELKAHDGSNLQQFDSEEQQIVNQFDPKGSFPFLFINGQYARIGDSGYSPGLIDSMTFDALQAQVTSGAKTDATAAISAEADLITAYICHSTGGQPAAACKT